MKIAKVLPVFKKGDVCELCNYRRMSLLSQFLKGARKIIHC